MLGSWKGIILLRLNSNPSLIQYYESTEGYLLVMVAENTEYLISFAYI